jgi:hypothetical protein
MSSGTLKLESHQRDNHLGDRCAHDQRSNSKGKVAVVTGASTGIGREVTVALSMSGTTVCIIGRPRRRSQNLPACCCLGAVKQ